MEGLEGLDPEQQRIRGYLVSQAAKLTVPQLVEKLQQSLAEVRQAANAVPAAQFQERPAAEEWSAAEVMAHVLRTSGGIGQTIVGVIEGRLTAPGTLRDEIEADDRPGEAARLCAELAAQRQRLFEQVLIADPEARTDVRWPHPAFGPLNWREWLLFMRIHDLDHARQMAAITAGQG